MLRKTGVTMIFRMTICCPPRNLFPVADARAGSRPRDARICSSANAVWRLFGYPDAAPNFIEGLSSDLADQSATKAVIRAALFISRTPLCNYIPRRISPKEAFRLVRDPAWSWSCYDRLSGVIPWIVFSLRQLSLCAKTVFGRGWHNRPTRYATLCTLMRSKKYSLISFCRRRRACRTPGGVCPASAPLHTT